MFMRSVFGLMLMLLYIPACATAQEDSMRAMPPEGFIRNAELPAPLFFEDGAPVATPEEWRRRRAEIITHLEGLQYGAMPPAPASQVAIFQKDFRIVGEAAQKLKGALQLGPPAEVSMEIGYYRPLEGEGPFPVILALEPVWDDHLEEIGVLCAKRGYIFAGYQRHDLDPDDEDRGNGLHPKYPEYAWGTLAVWAWGAMRMLDFLEELPEADASRVAIWGHSRAGKTALLAGALDERFAMVAPHCSGAGGAGCWRIQPKGVETLDLITHPMRFHYWFVPRLREFAGHEEYLPFDQHLMKALVAPRALVSFEAREDTWANPEGTVATWRAAQPVFDFLGAADRNSICFRDGGHDIAPESWAALLDYADFYLKGEKLSRERNVLP
jgi:fermentation-respiration switch protein FrsA (DUF1100 family)